MKAKRERVCEKFAELERQGVFRCERKTPTDSDATSAICHAGDIGIARVCWRVLRAAQVVHGAMLSNQMPIIPLPFDAMNEMDVRVEVIDPLIRQLGYQIGTRNDVIREQSLRYPKQSLGRKNPKKDPELRGKADYILRVEGRLHWVIEAKPPSTPIGIDDIEQSWTYANHPEVRAVYFVLCNGRALVVYRTTDGPQAEAVLSLTYETLDTNFHSLASLLSPDALLRDFSRVQPDFGIPIAPGLRSIARIASGLICFRQSTPPSSVFQELQTTISDGALERDDEGRLVTFLKTVVPSRSWQELNERLHLSSFEMISQSKELATEGQPPTVFRYQGDVTLAKGEMLLDISTWTPRTLPFNLTITVVAEAKGTYRDRVFYGTFATKYSWMGVDLGMSGTFAVTLA